MTSRRSSDRTGRADSSQRRPTIRRGIKKRGILPSFGDIVLPIVSVAAVGLLVLAGRQFFLNGIKTPPGISSTRAYAEAPALIAEREREQERRSEVTVSIPISGERNENASLDAIVKQETVTPTTPPATVNVAQTPPAKPTVQPRTTTTVQPTQPQTTTPKTTPPAKTTAQPKTTTPKVPPKTTPPKTQPAKTPAKTTPTKTQTTPPKTTTPKTTATPSANQWRVQIGAYTSKAGAQEAANKLKKAGYNAVVYSNPASKHHKVWVAGGPDKKSAEKVVNAMKKLGYGSSFAFPPSK